MTNWIEDVTLVRRYDVLPSWEKGRRAKIWHFEGYEHAEPSPRYWEVKEGERTIHRGETNSRGKALAAVERAVRVLGWV